jgi:hypothetical protein
MSARSVTRKKSDKPQAQAYAPFIEFTAAAHEHVEPAFDITVTPGAATQFPAPIDVPAYGYVRHIGLQITCSGGTAGPGVLSADGPWNLFSEITLLDVNGAPIFGPMDGYSAMIANLFGGYCFRQDPASQPDFSSAVVTFTFVLRIPVEIHHNSGLGALPNQNSASSYKVRLSINPSTVIWSTAPTTPPAVRIRGWLEAWSQPAPTDLAGRAQSIAPPMPGTTQYWTKVTKPLVINNNVIRVDKVGNMIRGLVFVIRDAGGARSSTVPPDPLTINVDARQLTRMSQQLWRTRQAEAFLLAGTWPTGVFPYMLTTDVLGHGGDGTPELWLPTQQSTRLELVGDNYAAVGAIDILVNDVAPAEISPAERYVETSTTGFHPAT